MGIKGKRRKERLRAARGEDPAMAGRQGFDDDGDDEGIALDPGMAELEEAGMLPEGIVAPSRMKMKKSELYDRQDIDYLEAARAERDGRKGKQPAASAKKKHRAEGAESLSATVNPDEVFQDRADELGDDGSKTLQTKRNKSIDGPEMNHPAVGITESVTDALALAGFTKMTTIQARAVPLAMQNYDILGQAKTGSGKTLAFGIPLLQAATEAVTLKPQTFVALALSPTKELSAQINIVFREVCKFLKAGPKQEPGFIKSELITGGTKMQEERRRLLSCHVAVGTPGRVLDHVQHTPAWTIRTSLSHFVMDEADRLLADGFQRDLDGILSVLPPARQTMLFSATNSKSVRELARLSLGNGALFVSTKGDAPRAVDGSDAAPPYVDFAGLDGSATELQTSEAAAATATAAGDDEAIPSKLRQFCQVVPTYDRLRALYAFVKRMAKKRKAMVFCATVASAQFHCMMMGAAGFHDDVLMLHGKMKHRQRLATFDAFQKWDHGVLFCTDVAARGLDIPHVDWILQYDPPMDPTEYIHRIGRTARAGAVGSALMFVSPGEEAFVKYLSKYGIELEVLPDQELPDIHWSLLKVLELDSVVAQHAVTAFRAHVNAYQSHVLKSIFDVRAVNLEDLAISFALSSVPQVSLPKSTAEEKSHDYVKGKLKSLRARQGRARAEYERLKTKQQWGDNGSFVGMRRPEQSV